MKFLLSALLYLALPNYVYATSYVCEAIFENTLDEPVKINLQGYYPSLDQLTKLQSLKLAPGEKASKLFSNIPQVKWQVIYPLRKVSKRSGVSNTSCAKGGIIKIESVT